MPEITINAKGPHWRYAMQTSEELADVIGVSCAIEAGDDARAEAVVAALGLALNRPKLPKRTTGNLRKLV